MAPGNGPACSSSYACWVTRSATRRGSPRSTSATVSTATAAPYTPWRVFTQPKINIFRFSRCNNSSKERRALALARARAKKSLESASRNTLFNEVCSGIHLLKMRRNCALGFGVTVAHDYFGGRRHVSLFPPRVLHAHFTWTQEHRLLYISTSGTG